LETVHCNEGDRVSPGAVLARLEVPDLASRLARKCAELREAEAHLRLTQAGPRYEEVEQQRRRVERAVGWRDQAKRTLGQQRQALKEDLARLEKQAAQYRAECDAARESFERIKALRYQGSSSPEEYGEARKKYQVARALWEQARAKGRARRARGALEAETELARRERGLADARAALTLIEAGPRPEEVEAARARRARLREEVRYLERLRGRLVVLSPVAGLVTTPRLKEKVGRYLREGE
jgi:multidrug resistance efflux pump